MVVVNALQLLGICIKTIAAHFEQNPDKVKDYQKLAQFQVKLMYEWIYIDETGIDTYLYRTYARCIKDQKVLDKIGGRWYQRISLVAGQMDKKPQSLIATLVHKDTTMRNCLKVSLDRCCCQVLMNLAKPQ